MNAIEREEISDMAKAPQTAAADADAIAATEADSDAAIAQKAEAEEAQLKAEAEAMRAGTMADEDAAAAEVDPILFDAGETGLDGVMLADWATAAARWLIFGVEGQSVAGIAPQLVQPKDWRIDAGQIVFGGDFTILTPEGLTRVAADSVALADGPDGPVRAVSALGGPVAFAAGAEFRFGPGAFVFG